MSVTTTTAPGTPQSRDVWFMNETTGKVAVVTVAPGQSPAQVLAARKERSIKRGHVWSVIDLRPVKPNKLHTVQSKGSKTQ